VSKDIVTDIATSDEETISKNGTDFARKFSLSESQGIKVIRTLHDFAALQSRSDQDLADFAKRLYGVDPARILSASQNAQLGDPTELDAVVSEAARGFDTTPENMKAIVKTLHGRMLEQNGIEL
jgi:hypothetical protein